ncbi:hypothetical protein N9C96_00240 [bacterium]|nr:hypothetical protein [bacterium]
MDQHGTSDEVLISVAPSPARRWLGFIALAGLGVLCLGLAFQPGEFLWRLFSLALAAAAFYASNRLRLATIDSIDLTRTQIRTGSGRVLAHVSNVKGVERGALAFKPSNGFLVRLHEPEGRGWAPGLWWQRGKVLGIGGVIPGGQARAMAEILGALQLGVLPEE